MEAPIFLLLVYLLPILFMIHDFEEIIFLKSPLTLRNQTSIKDKYPRLSKKIFGLLENISTPAYCMAVAEEFIILSAITIHALLTGFYYLWIGAFLAFSIHIVMHIVQWIVVQKYIPCIVTSFLCLPYCLYGSWFVFSSGLFELKSILIWGIGCILFTAFNLVTMLKISRKINL